MSYLVAPLKCDLFFIDSISINSPYSRSPVKSIFEGATKYDILHYLEDARDRGLTNFKLELIQFDVCESPVSCVPEVVQDVILGRTLEE